MESSEARTFLWNWLESVVETSENASPYRPRGHSVERTTKTMDQLRRYIIEIVAFTLKADFVDLNIALDPERTKILDLGWRYTILDPHEKAELKCLSCILQEMRTSVLHKRWNFVSKEDRQKIRDAILNPLQESGMYDLVAYVFQMIGLYTEHECDRKRQHLSMIARHFRNSRSRPPNWVVTVRKIFTHRMTREEKLQQEFRSHSQIIRAVSPNENVERLLRWALVEYAGEKDVGGVTENPEYICLAADKGYLMVEEYLDN